MIFHFLSHVYLHQYRILAGALPLSKYLLMENQVQEEETISKVFKLSGGIRVRIPQDLDVAVFGLGISMSWFFSLGISTSWLFVFWKNVLESRCRGLIVSISQCRGFLVLESGCRGICASTASFSFSLNLLYHIINVDMWVVNWCKLFYISWISFWNKWVIRLFMRMMKEKM